MGYYVSITGSDFRITPENQVLAYQAMCELNNHDELKRGGSWSGGEQTEAWFSWMPKDYPTECRDFSAILECLGFFIVKMGDEIVELNYDDKTGQEDLFLNACAPFVEDGSYIDWRGEDGDAYRFAFSNCEMKVLQGRLVFSEYGENL